MSNLIKGRKFTAFLQISAIILILYSLNFYSYLLFHALAEIVVIALALGIFFVAWNSRNLLNNNYFLIIGISCFFIAIFDSLHMLSHAGMGIIKGSNSPNLASQLLLVSGYLFSISFLIAPFFIKRKLKAEAAFFIFSLVSTFFLLIIFYWKSFPVILNEGGITNFGIVNEYVVLSFSLLSFSLLSLKRKSFNKTVFGLLFMALWAKIATEVLYSYPEQSNSIVVHIVNIIIYYLCYLGLVEIALMKPYSLIFKDLKDSEMALRDSEERYRSLVEFFPDGVYVQKEGKIVYANSSGLQILGASTKEELLNKELVMVIDEEEKTIFKLRNEMLLSGDINQTSLAEFKVIKIDGKMIHVEEKDIALKFRGEKIVLAIMRDITEKKKTEKEREDLLKTIREDQNQKEMIARVYKQEKDILQVIMENTETHLAYLDKDFNFIKVNSNYAKITGYLPFQLIGKNYFNLFPDKSYRDLFKKVKRKGISITLREKSLSHIFKDRTGDSYWDIILAPVKNRIGFVNGIVISLINVTKHKKLEDKQRYHSNVLRNISDAIYSVDLDFNVRAWNKGAEDLYGWTADEILNKPLFNFIKPHYPLVSRETIMAELFKNGSWRGDIIHTNKEGKSMRVLSISSLLKNRQGEIRGIISINHDVTEKRIDQERNEREKAKIEALLSSIGDGIVALDQEEKILFINKAFESISGFKAEELLNKPLKEMATLQDEKGECLNFESNPIYMTLASGKSASSTFLNPGRFLLRKDNTRIPIAITSTPIVLDDKTIGAVAVYRDITKEKEIDRAKTEFISLASHELRTPLASISLAAELLLRGVFTEDKQKKYFQDIYISTHRMSELIGTLLNVSRIELGTFVANFKEIELARCINKIIEEFTVQISEKQIVLKKIYGENLPNVVFDLNALRIIIQNLFANALRYTKKGGQIALRVERKNEEVLIRISDTGCGIPQNQQDKIFGKLFRADNAREISADGFGLGLYIVKSIIKKMGGKIWFKSPIYTDPATGEDRGTMFYVSLPIKRVNDD